MKKLLILTLLFAFIGIDIQAQSWTPVNGRQRFVSGIGIPVRDTLSPNAADTSQMVIRPQDGVLYYRRTGAWIRASAQDLSNYVTIDGFQTITGAKIFNPTLTASGRMARSVLISGLLTAALDSDTLVGLDIQPVFNLNSKAGVQRRWLRVGGNYNDSAHSFIKLTNNGIGTNTGGAVEWPFNQKIQGTFSEGLRFYNKNGTDYWTATATSMLWQTAPTLTSSQNNGEFNIKSENGTLSKIIYSVGGYHSFKVYTAPATYSELVRINSSGLNLLNLTGSGTRMATISSTGLMGTAALPYTTGYIDSNFLPLTAGITKPLTGTLYGTAIIMNNNITANTFIKATGTANQIMLADGSVLDKTNIYTGDATFDTTGRVLTLPKVGGGSTSVVIPRGTSSGAEGITALSSSRTGNLVTVSGDNGSSTVFTIRDADSASIVKFSDSTTILAGRWLPNRSADSIRVLRTLINTKGSGNGTVTSIATNNGSGITGGTITSTGTLAIDTATTISTKANVTASLLAYTTISRFLDSLTAVQSRIQSKQPLGNYLTFADSSTILAGRWLPNRSADSIAVIRALVNTKQPIGNYITFADSTTILAGRWLPNRSADSIAAIRALANTKGVGTVTSVAASAGTGISVSGSPITSSGTITITNTAPDQVVSLTAGTGISVSGTYPNFTVTNSSPSSGGTVTSVGLSAPTGFSVSGSPVTSSGTLALSFASGYSLPTDASQTNWNTAFNKRLASASFSASTLTLTLADASTVTTSVPTFNQNTTGTAASLSAVLSSSLGGAGAVNGILKANGSGTVSAAVAGTDFVAPSALNSYLPLTAGSGNRLSGSIYSANNQFIYYRNAANSADIIAIGIDGNNDIRIAPQATPTKIDGTLTLGGALSGPSLSMSSTGAFGGNVTTSGNTYASFVANGGATNGGGGINFQRQGTSFGAMGVEGYITGGTESNIAIFADASKSIKFMTGGSVVAKATLEADGTWLVGTTTTDGVNKAIINGGLKATDLRATGYVFFTTPNSSLGAGSTNSSWFEANTGTAFNVRVNGGDRLNVTDALAVFNVPIQLSSNALNFNQVGTRSWAITPSGGNLNFTSGDGLGIFNYTGAITVSSSMYAAGYRFAYAAKSSNYTLTDNDDYVIVTNSSTLTLPTAVGRAGKRYVIRSTAGAGITSTLATTSSQTVDGAAGSFAFGNGNYNILIVFSDGANWLSEQWITGS